MGRGSLRGRVAETGSPAGGLVVVGLVAYRLMRQTKENTMNGKLVCWAFCCWREQQGRTARGFVLASNEHDAIKKARKRVVIEKRRAAGKMGLPAGSVPPAHRRGRYGVRVWEDPDKATAPHEARHYTERRTA